MSNKNNLEGYSPIRDKRKHCFNTNVNSKPLTENATPVTQGQKQQAAQRLQDLIIKTQNDLTEDCL